MKKEAERIRLLDMAENSTEDVVAFLFKLRCPSPVSPANSCFC